MIFSLRQLQEKCREQRQPLFIAFIDLSKALDLVSRDDLFKILPKIGCPPRLLSIIISFHEDMKGTVVFDGSTSAAFNIRSGVKQGCVLAPTLFGIFFAVMLKHAFGPAAEGIYLRTRADGKFFNLSRLRAKTKVQLRCLRDFLFADDAAVTAHSAEDLQQLMTQTKSWMTSSSWSLMLMAGAESVSCPMTCVFFKLMVSLRRILNITWQDKVPNNTVLERAGCTSMFTLLKQRRMRWLGHVVRMDDGRISKDLLHEELVQGKRPTGRPQLQFKDVCKRDLNALNIDQNNWEATALRRSA